jgi:hypothetical protein
MSTLRQIEANRRNAKKSTGPTSVTGKATSSMNALKTGIHAESLVLPIENPADLEALTDEYYRHYRPASPIARAFVDDLIRCEWHLRRFDNAETQMWQYQNQSRFDDDEEEFPLGKSGTCNSGSYSKLQYRVDATRRARARALQALEKLQAEGPSAPPVEPVPPVLEPVSIPASAQTTSPRIGFVPSPPVPSPAPPAPAAERGGPIRAVVSF